MTLVESWAVVEPGIVVAQNKCFSRQGDPGGVGIVGRQLSTREEALNWALKDRNSQNVYSEEKQRRGGIGRPLVDLAVKK